MDATKDVLDHLDRPGPAGGPCVALEMVLGSYVSSRLFELVDRLPQRLVLARNFPQPTSNVTFCACRLFTLN